MKPTLTSVCTFAPATVANVACGYDVLGFCLEEPGDEVTASISKTDGIRIIKIEGDAGLLSKNSAENCCSVAAQSLATALKIECGIDLKIKKGMPLGSGLGSSAASSAAAVMAVNALFGSPLSRQELVVHAMEGERLASGSAHADNVAPSLLGGFTIIRSYNPLDIIALAPPKNLYCTVVSPQIEIRTSDARRVLKKNIPLSDAVLHFGNIAGLVAGILQKDTDLVCRSIEDFIVEPDRSPLIPGFMQAKKAAHAAGALAFSISGSGPSVFAFSGTKKTANGIGAAIKHAFGEQGIESTVYISNINPIGATIVQPQ